MFSYIFNSKIIKIFLSFLVLFIAYNIYLYIYNPKITIYQNQRQKNKSYAEKFIYMKDKPLNIIVGSSMSATMKNEWLLNDNIYNLSFSGGSVLTGLEIIKKSGFIPKNIFIEANIAIIRDFNERLIDEVFTPILWNIKYYIPALRETYQPLNILLSKIKNSYGKSHEEHMKDRVNEYILTQGLDRNIKNYNKHIVNYKNKLLLLKKQIDYFISKGVKITFFLIPMDEKLINSVKIREEMNILIEKFPDICWIPYPSDKKFYTQDSIHLIYPSAYSYTKYFLRKKENCE